MTGTGPPLVQDRQLTTILRVDGLGSLVSAVLLIALSGWIEDVFGLSPSLALVLGAALLPWSAWLLVAAARPTAPTRGRRSACGPPRSGPASP